MTSTESLSVLGLFPSHGLLFSALIISISIAISVLHSYWKLKHIPGPFWASLTDIPRAYWVTTGHSHEIHTRLHIGYGDFVRIGPNMVSISDPQLISLVYPMRTGLPKGNFYRSLTPYSRQGALPLVFNTRDEKLHMQLKKPIAPLFSLSNVLTFEHFVDDSLSLLFEQFNQRFIQDSNSSFDLGNWLQFFAFETMGMMTFSQRYGFFAEGDDSKGLLGAIWMFMKTAAPITQIPWLDLAWYKNPVVTYFLPTTGMPILQVVNGGIQRRIEELEKQEFHLSEEEVSHGDFLSRFLDVQRRDASVPAWAVTAWTFSNVIAGSDSTASVMKTLWYHLLSNHRSQERLYTELLQAEREKALTRPHPSWGEIARLPYLDACVNEAIRLHPPFCLPFERVVPQNGIEIGGRFLPGGTVIGINPWVVNHDRGVFGQDADDWRPERWLESKDRYREMEQSNLTFGAGRRACLGKNIALLEIKKLTASLMINYEFKILDRTNYQVENLWFFRQWGLDVQVSKRATPTQQS